MTTITMKMRAASVAIITFLAISAVGTIDAMAFSTPMTTVACATPDAFGTAFREWVLKVAQGGDSTATERADLGISALSDTAIVFVTDSTLCSTAATRHAAVVGQDTITPPAVHLLRLGSLRYVAFNGASAGEFSKYVVFDQSFVYKLTYGM